jgi:hypothetical protein
VTDGTLRFTTATTMIPIKGKMKPSAPKSATIPQV